MLQIHNDSVVKSYRHLIRRNKHFLNYVHVLRSV
jgi:hypothetical protein